MALDPLKFKIAIERRELDEELKKARKTLEDGLKDVPIRFKIANLEEIKKQLESLEVKINASASSSQKKESESLKNDLNNMEKLLTLIEKVSEAMNEMGKLRGSKNLVDGFTDAETKLKEFWDRLNNVNTNDSKAIANIIAEWKTLGSVISEVTKKQQQQNKSDSASDAKFTKSMENAKKVLAEIEVLLDKLRSSKSKADGLGINTDAIQKQIAALEKFKASVESIANGTTQVAGFKATPSGDLAAQMTHAKDELQKLDKQVKETEKSNEQAAKAAEKNAQAMQKAASSAGQMTSEEQKLAQAIQQSISQMNHQSQVLNDLKSMAMQYLSVYAGQQFLNNIIEIGGQLEMQRLSIGAILQDTAHANDLFDRIKSLALQSPFGVVELDQFTKQLSAYGFKYNELFDMTKRLADISAGAGTDVSRLALALGHVRSEGALTGYTLRQFAMNNIPMLGKLSEKLSELEGKIVTAGEVRKRVRNKEIDYDMVESVIKDLTNEGGMFYNMQEVISGSVKAKWKNLHDAFDIMFGEMAESGVGGALKDVATTLTKLAKSWKEIGTVVMSVVGVYMGAKGVMLAYNTLLGQQARGVFAGIAADRQATVAKLQYASAYRKLTLDERVQLGLGTRLNSVNLAMALNTNKLTIAELERGVALGKVNRELAIAAVMNSNLSNAQKIQMIQTLQSIRTYGMFTGVINGGAMALRGFAMAMKGLLLNPATWVFALIAVITDLWQRNNQEMEQAAELSKKLAERSAEGIKNVRTMMKETDMTYNQGEKDISASFGDIKGGTFKWKPAAEMDTAGMIQTMERWTDFINQYAATPNTLLGDAWRDASGKVRDLADQYEHLAQAVAMVAEAQVDAGRLSEAVEYALGKTDGGWFNDNLVTNLNDYAKRMKTFNNTLTDVGRSYPKVITAALNAAKTDAKFAQAVKDANDVMLEKEGRNLTEIELVKRLYEGQENYNNAFEKFKTAANQASGMENFHGDTGLGNDYRFMANAKAEAERDMQTFADSMKAKMQGMGWDLENLTESQKQAILYAIKDVVGQSADSTEELKKMWESIAATYFGIKIDADTVEAVAKTNELEKSLSDLVGHPWKIDIKAVSNFGDLITKIRQDYKSAQDYFNNVKPLMIKMGINVSGGMKRIGRLKAAAMVERYKLMYPDANPEMIKQMVEQWNLMVDMVNDAMDFSDKTGISLSDPNPGGKVYRDKKGKSSKDKKGSEKDEQAKAWRERIRQLKDARSWYDKWEKEVGDTAALEKVQEIFHGLIKKEDIETLEAYEKALKAVKAEAEARKSKNKGKDERADEIIRQADDELAQIDMQKFQRDSKLVLSMMERDIEDVTRRWEIFNNVLEATGDRERAMKIANFDIYDRAFNTSSPADALVNHIGQKMMMPNIANEIDWDKILVYSDEEIEKYVKNWLGGTNAKKTIDGVIKSLKEWRKLEQDYIKKSLDGYAKLIGSVNSWTSSMKKNNAQFDETRKELNKLLELGQAGKEGGITKAEYDDALELARITRDVANDKLSSEYLTLMNNANSMTKNEVFAAIANQVAQLDAQFSHGLINVEQYVNEMEKLRDIQSEWEKNGFFGEKGAFGSLLTGGSQGLLSYYSGQEKKWSTRAAEAREKYGEHSIQAISAQTQADKYAKLQKALEKVTDSAEDIVKAFETLQAGLGLIGGLFDALGMEGASNTVGAASSVLGGALSGASSLSALGPYGMAAGAAIGGVTALIQEGDKRKEQKIQELKEEVSKIGNTLNLIRTGRGRTLGYDVGSYRRSMASAYEKNEGTKWWEILYYGGRNQAMNDYYTRGGVEGNGYEQELAALKKQREAYLEMYSLEKSKKDESSEALEEYKAKVAELDDQIMYYTEDLAKELWSIDLIGWADQIGDALMNAFENGTSAALAFKDATQNILRSVVNEMLKVGIIQPMMESLREKLFGENGAFNYSDPQGSMGKVLAELGRFFGEGGEGQMMMVAGQEFLTGAEQLLNENFGMTLKGGSSQATQTSGIQSQATEESIGIVSGQLARIAQDVSVKRIFVTQLVTDQMPKLLENAQMQRTLLENQFQSVRAIEHMMSDGSGAMYETIDRMSRKIDRAITPDGKMRIE